MNKIFLWDGYALIYRAYFAFINNPRINSAGMNTSAIFGFTNTLLDILERHKPTHLCVLFDPPEEKSERGVIFDQYKANRQAMPEDLKSSIPYVKELLESFRIPYFIENGYEADDLIATLARRFAGDDTEVYIVSPDKDLSQLVSRHIYWYKPGRMGAPDEILDETGVCKKFEIETPRQVVDLLAMMGDSSDNIPGIPGVGEKTALKFLKEFGSLEQLLSNTDKLQGKIKEKVEAGRELALLSKKLATVIDDVPLQIKLEDLRVKELDKPRLKKLFDELEFRRLADRVFSGLTSSGTSIPATLFDINELHTDSEIKNIYNTPHHYQVISTLEDIEAWMLKILHYPCVSFDTETDRLESIDAQLVGISFSWATHQAVYIPIPEDKTKALLILERLKPLLSNSGITKVAHNLKFDLCVLRNYGIDISGPVEDTLLMHYIIDPESRHNLDALSYSLLKYQTDHIEELIGNKGPEQLSMRQVSVEKVAEYAGEDADITLQLRHKLLPLLKERGGEKVFSEIEIPLVPVLEDMERTGVRIDVDYLKELTDLLSSESLELEKKIYGEAGMEFNISSPRQLGEVLFDRLKLDEKAKRTGKTKQYATSEDVLEALSHKHPIVNLVLEYREIQKLKSTYIDALPVMINSRTGRIHTSFNQAVTATGRLSSQNPNLQNIPIRTERGQAIRKAFIASGPDFQLLSVDYSQVELRIIASMSGEENMIEAFISGQDIHASTAARLYSIPIEKVTKEMRSKAKMVNFGIIYGITPFGLAQRTGLSKSEAADIIQQYFKQYPRIKDFMDRQIAFARQHGFVETLYGRRRYIRDINSANPTVRGFAERMAINAPIQGTAADIIKLAMIRIYNSLNSQKFKTKLILQVHDELLLDGPAEEMDEVRNMVVREMKNASPFQVPAEVQAGCGLNWLDAHE